MTTIDDELDTAIAQAERMLKSAGGDYAKLAPTVATFLRVHGAQGIIDNGSYVYFFESDWEGKPPYDVFVDAYAAIGCARQAAELRRIVETFPFPEPHLRERERQDYMQAHLDEATQEVRGWGDLLCGDASVWNQLVSYWRANSADFTAERTDPA
jgi:hypothetical protein